MANQRTRPVITDAHDVIEPCGYGNLYPYGSTTTPLYRAKSGGELTWQEREFLKKNGWRSVVLSRKETSTRTYGRFWIAAK